MDDLHPKFVLYDGTLILGKVRIHAELLPIKYDSRSIMGGGWWRLDEKNKVLGLYGTSQDFGKFDPKAAVAYRIALPSLRDYKVKVLDSPENRGKLIEQIEGMCGSLLSIPWHEISFEDLEKLHNRIVGE